MEEKAVDAETAAMLRTELTDGVARSGLTIDQVVARSRLGRTTVSQALNSVDRVPSSRTVAVLARVLNLDERRVMALRSAALAEQQVDANGLGKPIGECDPLDLEVHPAGERRESRIALPGYVSREHDVALAELVAAAHEDGRSGMAVLVGSSSTGKTRACWEAVQPLARDGWRLWHPYYPTSIEAARAGVEHVGPRTVVWLNEAQRYLDLGEEMAAAIHAVLTDSSRAPVLVLCTLWPTYERQYSTRPRLGQPDTYARTRELLAGRCLTVPDEFDEAALQQAEQLAAGGDRDLSRVLDRDHRGRIAQHLAGTPELLRRYETAQPAAKALLHAAMDARRLGVDLDLPLGLLADAAAGYLDPDELDVLAEEDWLELALKQLGEPVHGNLAPLRLVRHHPRQVPPHGTATPTPERPFYRLTDILEQHGRQLRRPKCPPASFWIAAHTHVDEASVLARLGKAASDRYRSQWADAFYRRAAEGGDAGAMCELARMRENVGDIKEAVALYWQAAHSGRVRAFSQVVEIWASTGHLREAEELALHAAEAGDASGLRDVAWAHCEAGNGAEGEAMYRRAAEAGDRLAMNELACMHEERGEQAEAEQWAFRAAEAGYPYTVSELVRRRESAGNSAEAERLAFLAVERGSGRALGDLAWMRAQAGKHSEAEALYQRAADLGDMSSLYEIALIRELAGDHAQAEILYAQANEAAGSFASQNLVMIRERAGASEEAERLAAEAAQAGDPAVLTTLATMRDKAGAHEVALAMYERAARAGDTMARGSLALQRDAAGDHEGADRLALQAADAGDSSAINTLARERGDTDSVSRTRVLRYGLDPDGKPAQPW